MIKSKMGEIKIQKLRKIKYVKELIKLIEISKIIKFTSIWVKRIRKHKMKLIKRELSALKI
jgi:hypothetical protein